MGVRSSTAAADGLVRRMLAAHLVEDPAAPPNFSLELHPPSASRAAAEPLHRLFDGHMQVARHRRPERVLRALVGYLSRFAPPDPEILRFNALAVRGAGGAVLVPSRWRRRAAELEHHLRRAGLSLIDAPHAWLDVRSGVVLAPSVAHVDSAVLDDLGPVAAGAGLAANPPPTGPFVLRGWVLPSAGDEPVRSRADALVRAMGLARNLAVVGGGRALHAIAARLREVPALSAPPDLSDADATALVVALIDRA